MQTQKFRSKRETVEAHQWDGQYLMGYVRYTLNGQEALRVQTPAGVAFITKGDWLINPSPAYEAAQDVMLDAHFKAKYESIAVMDNVDVLRKEFKAPVAQCSPKSNGWYSHAKHTMQHYYSHSALWSLCGNDVNKPEYFGLELAADTSKPFCPGCKAALEVGLRRIEEVAEERKKAEVEAEAKRLAENAKAVFIRDRYGVIKLMHEAAFQNKSLWASLKRDPYNHALKVDPAYSSQVPIARCLSTGYSTLTESYDPTKPDCPKCLAHKRERGKERYKPADEQTVSKAGWFSDDRPTRAEAGSGSTYGKNHYRREDGSFNCSYVKSYDAVHLSAPPKGPASEYNCTRCKYNNPGK